MNSPNQDKSDDNFSYFPEAGLEFFKQFGSTESVKQGKPFFAQGQKGGLLSFLQSDKTYFIVEGDVKLDMASGQVLLGQGELFGEFTPYTFANASATANSNCKVLTLSEKQLLSGLKKKPEFLFMLVDSLFKYLQQTDPMSKDVLLLTEHESLKHDGVLDADLLDVLKKRLSDDALMVVPENRVVFREGGAALLMYVILEGFMVIVVDKKVVGRSGRGDIVGEIALLAPKYSRTASVVAETRCTLLGMNRQTLLELIQALPSFGLVLLKVSISHFHGRRAVTK